MGSAVSRQLLFRLADIGFILDLASVVEIREHIAAEFDLSRSDLSHGIVGALTFRQTRIPVIDPTIRLDLVSSVPLKSRTVLVLSSPEGNWGLLVDRVGEIYPAERFHPCEMPLLLKGALLAYCPQIQLLDGEPLVAFRPDHYYGFAGIAA